MRFACVAAMLAGCGDDGGSVTDGSTSPMSCDGIPTTPTMVMADVEANFVLGDAIYFSRDGTSVERQVIGGVSSILASGLPDGRVAAVDDTHVYWVGTAGTGPDSISSIPKAGGQATLLTTEGDASIAVAKHRVYWFASGMLYSIAAGEGMPRLEATTSGSKPIADAAGDFVYWGNVDVIRRISAAGGGAMDVVTNARDASGQGVRGVAATASKVYWLTERSLNECAPGCSTRTPLVEESTNPLFDDVVFNGETLAWTRMPASQIELMKLKPGGLPTVVATVPNEPSLTHLAFSGCALAWTINVGNGTTNIYDLWVIAAP